VARGWEKIEDTSIICKEFLSYSRQYPRNSRSLTTFSCITNTVMLCREPIPFLLAKFLYILLIVKASLRLTSTFSHWTGSRFSFHTPQILPVSSPSGNSSGLAM
jgi:hypothetical protein